MLVSKGEGVGGEMKREGGGREAREWGREGEGGRGVRERGRERGRGREERERERVISQAKR